MSAAFENKVLSSFEQIEKRFEQMDQRFDQMDQKIEDRTDMIMNYIYDLSQDTKSIRKKVDSMDQRLQTVESIVKQRWDIPKLTDKVDALGYEVEKHTEWPNEHDRQLAVIAN